MVEAGECPIGIFCDLSREFVCVNHSALGNMLELSRKSVVGLPHLKTIGSSITNGNGNNLNRINSDFRYSSMGVPQGSIPEQVLFYFM